MAVITLKIGKLVNQNYTRIHPKLSQIVRPSSYQSSQFLEDLRDVKVKYEVTKDPVDWSFVERALPPTVVPEPVKKDKYPSGWRPQADNLKDRHYFIERTKNHMIPVYLELERRNTKKTTVIRKIQGDVFKLEKDLLAFLQKESFYPIRSQVNEFAGIIKIGGDFVNAVKYFLEKRQF
ncbi:unnamed protein product [Acanthoscelides obtectus]|uniref:Large ribosomal subunit protein mL49 n=1 Tax=Acanthoscelides obtectus TaxID=200917 RepID=A0A9P0KBX7_ACAOB|nr:unnamed protein product [Acanthoscelides obtectus]CAK1631194.1 Probable 39S ribosomal protein L49, mitochondrial [Acanthoscelides obtectus]